MANEKTAGVLAGLSDELAGVVARVAPSVVRIDDGSRLTATGVVWSADGLIATSSHGVERDEDLAIETHSGARIAAELVGRDFEADIAVLRVSSGDLVPITQADEQAAKVGQIALALGRPGTSALWATLGIVSARIETESEGRSEYVLYTDADMHRGFSGGALVNVGGELVGMLNLSFRRGSGVALGTPLVAHVVDSLLSRKHFVRGYVGISTHYVALPEPLREGLGLAQKHGLLVSQVAPGSGAEQAGIALGDVLIAFDGRTLEEPESLRRALRSLPVGQVVGVVAVRGGEQREFSVTLGEQP